MEVDLEVTYVYVVNHDLRMSKGKIAAQVSHVAMKMGDCYDRIGRALVFKSSESDMIGLMKDIKESSISSRVFKINDAGLTEVEPGSLTCIGFKVDGFIKGLTADLKLL